MRESTTGQGPSPSGRKTFVASFTPSRIGTITSWCEASAGGNDKASDEDLRQQASDASRERQMRDETDCRVHSANGPVTTGNR